MELILFLVSILPVVLIGLFIYKKDKDKEPAKILLQLFVFGILSCFLTLLLTQIAELIFPILKVEESELNLVQLLFNVFIGVALIEEFSKWIMVYKISYDNKFFDDAYDMIVYSVFVSLGFACFENLLYVFEGGLGVGFMRALVSVPGHACWGVLMGYYFLLAKLSNTNNNKKLYTKNIVLSLLIPMLLHGTYDYCLFSKQPILLLLFLILVISTYVFVLKKIKIMSKLDSKINSKTNFCPYCGAKVDGIFCHMCGKKLN